MVFIIIYASLFHGNAMAIETGSEQITELKSTIISGGTVQVWHYKKVWIPGYWMRETYIDYYDRYGNPILNSRFIYVPGYWDFRWIRVQ